jgi:hypothetical protein
MMHDDDFTDLDRMLAALPLEEPPPGLHSRILTTTIYRPVPILHSWELWAIAAIVALAAWFTWQVVSVPHLGDRIGDATSRLADAGGLDSLTTVLWLAVGMSAAWWVSQISIPSSRRIRIR